MPRRSNGNELVIITWRDIPAQVNGGSGENKFQRILPHRFHQAIDRAAMKAGKKTASEYVGEWGRRTIALPADFDGDFDRATRDEAARLENEFPTARLKLWVVSGGWDPDRDQPATIPTAAHPDPTHSQEPSS